MKKPMPLNWAFVLWYVAGVLAGAILVSPDAEVGWRAPLAGGVTGLLMLLHAHDYERTG